MRKCSSIATSALTIGGLLCFASTASAQQPAPAPAAAGGAAAPAGGAAAPAGDKEEEGRLRIGFNFLNGGIGTGGGYSGPTFGATFKIGYQLNRLMGVYGNISPFVWIGTPSKSSVGGASVDAAAIAGMQFAPLFSLTPADIFEVAAGPSLDYLTGGSSSASVNTAAVTASASVGAFSSVYFGVHGKVALHLGSRNEETGRRKGFTIEGNVHPSFTPGSAVTFLTLGLGYDWL